TIVDKPAARPRDWLIMVDTSASQGGGPLAKSIKLVESVVERIAKESKDDRVSIWTVSTKAADLGGGFKPARDAQQAIKALKTEPPAGGTNLTEGVAKALAAFKEEKKGRQRVFLYFGDGMSVEHPVTGEERTRLAADLVQQEVAFFPVPLGPNLHPHNLH